MTIEKMLRSFSGLCLISMMALGIAPAPATAGHAASQEYVANGLVTIFCEGDGEDRYLGEPWCLALNTLNGGEGSVVGGAEWDVASHLGSLAFYGANDDLGRPHTVLGMSDHGDIHEHAAGCGSLVYRIPADREGDDIDGGVHLVAQISLLHIDTDLTICLGSTGVATIDIA